MPGFTGELAGSLFPFWANYASLDFALANFRHLAPEGCRMVLEAAFRGVASHLPSRNGGLSRPILLEGAAPEALRELIRTLERDPAELVVLAPLSLVCIIQRAGLDKIAPRTRDPIIKLSLENAAVDVYAALRPALLELLRRALERGRWGGTANTESIGRTDPIGHTDPIGRVLFTEILHEAFDTIKDCPGALLFQNNLMQLYRQNLWIAENLGTPQLAAALEHLGEPRLAGKEVRIEKNGVVRNSFLGAGAVVDGLVEGSVIFPDVVVGKDAVVYNSVVMNGNRIAPRAQLYRTLVLPFTAEATKNAYNVGEGCSIGQRHSAATNFDHSSQIREGLTVLGLNVEVPKGLAVSAGCLLAAGVNAQAFKGIKEVRKGATVRWNTDQ
ncbi:MAG: hypothetical protein JW820_05410 [Spirochaetales bacterium]|nr:hypothetical protein [Spirochaetales bacterium]